jgi:pyridoxamine 5'-phosphate oxidase family protein
MSAFTDRERAYLQGADARGPRLARLATVGRDGTPHVVPTGFTYVPDGDVIEIGGIDNARTKKFRDVERTGRAAVVVDDLASVSPWRPRGVEVRGRAEARTEPRAVIRIHPERVRSWGLDRAAPTTSA